MDLGLVIAVAIGFFLLAGVATILWWRLADRFFPGTTRKTGQEIRLLHKRAAAPGPAPTVVKAFEKASEPPRGQ